MTHDTMDAKTSSPQQRRATALLMHLTEPGRPTLKAACLQLGAEDTLELITGGRDTAIDALQAIVAEQGMEPDGVRLRNEWETWNARLPLVNLDNDAALLRTGRARLVIPGDAEWPHALDDLGLFAPLGLWVRGGLPLNRALVAPIAIVGTRAATEYGLALTRTVVMDLVGHGHTVVSGGALGIDAVAHAAALDAAAARAATEPEADVPSTVAVMACGIDQWYPKQNSALLDEVAARSAVVTELPPGATAMRHRFLDRNRIIAALSLGTIVMEAGWRSGSFSTANKASGLMRPVGAFPGSVFNGESAGCHKIIREGQAVLVSTAAEVRELVGGIGELADTEGPAQPVLTRPTDGMSPEQLRLYSALPLRGGVDPTVLAVKAGITHRQAMAALAELELTGHAEHSAAGWVKVRGTG
ncbi:DNA-processing protein DprA [Brevibacterium moorei]|uniref:DNA-processing protein DprA n=1 Tax=Brevibacterium moorei TaxID=2968457 RepID=UPI00211D0B41|nr:DNA-processing protein DprA [Brevibacterium sp. 68QC2CO]MCQ9384925.1 DNA-protecting protein DprA [Brevibacterium sp. 68QC2CO]